MKWARAMANKSISFYIRSDKAGKTLPPELKVITKIVNMPNGRSVHTVSREKFERAIRAGMKATK
jgi:hypothetical protein